MTEDITKNSTKPESDSKAKTAAPAKAPVKIRKKQRRSVPAGQLHVHATFNNTIISFSDKKGNVLCSSSAGACGFSGSKKGTAYASQIATEKACEIAKAQFGIKSVDVSLKGVGLGRDSAIRTMTNFDIIVDSIKDVTGIPHGGVRPRKARRA